MLLHNFYPPRPSKNQGGFGVKPGFSFSLTSLGRKLYLDGTAEHSWYMLYSTPTI